MRAEGACPWYRMSALSTTPEEVLLALEPTFDAAGRARRALHEVGLPQDIDHTVTLLTSELVSNSVRHAGMSTGERIVLLARLDGDCAHVEVADSGPGFDPEVRHEAAGYGLRLIDKLATRWGTEPTARGTRVWFDIDRSSRRFDRDELI